METNRHKLQIKTVQRVDRSPLNPQRWCLTLSCGHEKWVTATRKPSPVKATCDLCPAVFVEQRRTSKPRKLRLREATKLAEGHAIGILESTEDDAFWGEEFFDAHSEDGQWQVLSRARKIVQRRLGSA